MPIQLNYQYDLFVSFTKEDCAWVHGYLLPALGLNSKRILTPEEFRPGMSVVSEFERAVTSSRFTVLVLSPAYLADVWAAFSEQLISYHSTAQEQEKLIPLLLQPCTLPLRISFRVKLDCTNEDKWKREVARLRSLLSQPEPKPEHIVCPYPGMVPFGVNDAKYFFGREKEIEKLRRILHYQKYLFVVGPSGSGKSSLVFAGLISQLQEQQRDQWIVKVMRPGNTPLRNLSQTFGLDSDTSTFGCEVIDRLLATHHRTRRVLFIIDQFEELFTQTPKREQANFIGAIKTLRQMEFCTIMLMMRADFYPDLMNSELWPLASSERVEIAPLRGESLRDAIIKPAERLGVYLEGRLVERIMSDAAEEPGVLPLVQEMMVRLWEKKKRNFIPHSAYETMGEGELSGLSVAVATKADATIARLAEPHRAVARRIFLRLVQFGEGRADTRRQQTLDQLKSVSDRPRDFAEVLHHLVDNRLLTLSGEEKGLDRKVDLSHETLINDWPLLRKWINKRRRAEETRRRLEVKASEWAERVRNSRSGGLLDEAQLSEAERWLASSDAADIGYDESLTKLVEASHERLLQDKKLLKELYEKALARQLAAQSELLRTQQTDLLQRSVLLAIESFMLFPSVEAEQALRGGLELLPRQVACLSHEGYVRAVAFSPNAKLLATGSNDQTARVWDAAAGLELARMKHNERVTSIAFSYDSRYLATASRDCIVRVWEAQKGLEVTRMTHEYNDGWFGARSIAFSSNRKYLLMGVIDRTVLVWEALSGREVALMAHADDIHASVLSLNGRFVATASGDCTAQVWKVHGGLEVARVTHADKIFSIALSHDTKYLATGSLDGTARIWKAIGGREVACLRHAARVDVVVFSPDRQRLATACLAAPGTIIIWEVASGREVLRIAHGEPVGRIAFSPNGKYLVTTGYGSAARMWDSTTGHEIARMSHDSTIYVATFSPDSRYMATGSADNTARVWEVTGQRACVNIIKHESEGVIVCLSPDNRFLAARNSTKGGVSVYELSSGNEISRMAHEDLVMEIVFSQDGKYLATADLMSNTAYIWEAATGLYIAQAKHEDQVFSVAFSPDSKYFVTASEDGTARLWEIGNSHEVRRMKHKGPLRSVIFSPNSKYIATRSAYTSKKFLGDIARVWQPFNGQEVACITHEGTVNSIAFSPDGRYISTGSDDGTARVCMAATGRELARMEHNDYDVTKVSFSPNSEYLMTLSVHSSVRYRPTASDSTSIIVWDWASGRMIARMIQDGRLRTTAFSSDSKFLATASRDMSARIWQISSGCEVARLKHDGAVEAVSFSADGQYLHTVSADKTVRVWQWRPEDLIREACARLTRNLTIEEWKQYIIDMPYRVTCPNLPELD